jgi:hypothetical protein
MSVSSSHGEDSSGSRVIKKMGMEKESHTIKDSSFKGTQKVPKEQNPPIEHVMDKNGRG